MGVLVSCHVSALFPCPERSNIFKKDKNLCIWLSCREKILILSKGVSMSLENMFSQG